MTRPRKRNSRLRKLVVLAAIGGAAFGYRHYRLSNAPPASWSNRS